MIRGRLRNNLIQMLQWPRQIPDLKLIKMLWWDHVVGTSVSKSQRVEKQSLERLTVVQKTSAGSYWCLNQRIGPWSAAVSRNSAVIPSQRFQSRNCFSHRIFSVPDTNIQRWGKRLSGCETRMSPL